MRFLRHSTVLAGVLMLGGLVSPAATHEAKAQGFGLAVGGGSGPYGGYGYSESFNVQFGYASGGPRIQPYPYPYPRPFPRYCPPPPPRPCPPPRWRPGCDDRCGWKGDCHHRRPPYGGYDGYGFPGRRGPW